MYPKLTETIGLTRRSKRLSAKDHHHHAAPLFNYPHVMHPLTQNESSIQVEAKYHTSKDFSVIIHGRLETKIIFHCLEGKL